MVNRDPVSMVAAAERFLKGPMGKAGWYYWRGRNITVDSEPSKAVWIDSEHTGRTPIHLRVLPGKLRVVVP